MALFITNATQVTPVGTFVGREAIEKYYGTFVSESSTTGASHENRLRLYLRCRFVCTGRVDSCAKLRT
jgi:hypothetical protein